MRLQVRGLPASLFAVTVALEVAAVALSWGLEPAWDTVGYAIYTVTLAAAGALIASRHPANPIGWLFCAAALLNALAADAGQGWGLRAAEVGWPAGTFGEWLAAVSWIPSAPFLVLTFLLFPDGRTLRPAWRVVAWLNVVGVVVLTPAWALSPDTASQFVGGRNPYAVDGFPSGALLAVGMPLFLGSLVASVVPLVLRLRAAWGVERQQLKWIAFAAVCSAVILPTAALLWNVAPAVRPLPALALTALPVAACIAILRYRLYDIDVVISRTLVYGTLTVVLAAGYAATALVVGTAVGSSSSWVTAGATLVVAVAFRPLRDRVQTGVDRRFSRARYDAVQQVADFLDDLRSGRAAPEEIEAVLRSAIGTESVELRFVLPHTGVQVDVRGEPVDDDADPADGTVRWPIRQGGTTIGSVLARTLPEERAVLVPQVLDTATLAIEITRLQVELRRQLDEVEASRARIVAVADEERRRVERDLHDGAQQRLVSIGLALCHVQYTLGPTAEPEASRSLDGAVAEISVTIDELRELARGLRPAHLDAGLGPALRELARRAPLPVHVDARPGRFPAEVETAAYFTACEGLTNAVKHARATKVVVRAGCAGGKLVVSVADDGIGGASPGAGTGLIGLSDRVAAQGGTLRIHSVAGDGTRLVAEFPCVS